jgi:hypothetical protein
VVDVYYDYWVVVYFDVLIIDAMHNAALVKLRIVKGTETARSVGKNVRDCDWLPHFVKLTDSLERVRYGVAVNFVLKLHLLL